MGLNHPENIPLPWSMVKLSFTKMVPNGKRLRAAVLWVVLCPPKRYIEVLIPSIYECDFFWKQVVCRYHQVTMRS